MVRKMDIVKDVFKRMRPDFRKLAAYGFLVEDGAYLYEEDLLDGTFRAKLRITKKGEVSGRVIEKELDEEYVNIYSDSQYGAFVGSVREAYIAFLEKIRDACFMKELFLNAQSGRIASYIRRQYGDKPEFIWSRYPGYAVFRDHRNGKWYAIIMNVDGRKIGLDQKEYEIIDVKADPVTISSLKEEKGFHEAYHMNKEKWLTAVLDESVDDEILRSLIDQSYDQVDQSDAWIVPANPAYYDVAHCFDRSESILWKQSSDIHVGDIVYMYVAQPFSAILYKCMAEETDIPYEYRDKKVSMSRVMRLRLLKRFKQDKYTFAYLNSLGIRAIRGPRRLKKEICDQLG